MITNYKKFQEFEKKLIAKERVNIKRNFKIIDALYYQARKLIAIPLKNPIEGLENNIRIAQIINSVPKTTRENRHQVK